MVLGVPALLVIAAVIAPFVLDLNDYKGYIANFAKEYSGRALIIDGDIDLSLLPGPTIKIGGVRLDNLQGSASPDMLRIAAVEARIAIAPLFRGRIEIDSLIFVDPVIEFETLADGSVNWQAASAGDGAGDGDAAALRINRLKIENATLIYRDSAKGGIRRVGNFYMEAAIDSFNGRYRAAGRFRAPPGDAKALPFTFEIDIDRLDRRPLSLRAVVKQAAAEASISFIGTASSATVGAEISGALKVEGRSMARLLAALGGGFGGRLPERPFSATGIVTATAAAMAINDIRLDFGGVRGSGSVSASFAGEPRIDIAIALNRIDLDALTATTAESGGKSGAGAGADSVRFRLPGGVYGTLDLKIDALVFNKGVVRQTRLVAVLDQGVMTLQQAAALLPGGSDITVFGILDDAAGKPHFTGNIYASANNLRTVLDWLKITYPEVPADRLRKLNLSTKIDVTPDLAKISALDLRVDLSRLSGGVNIGFGEHPAFNAVLAIDKINLDAYLPADDTDTESDGAANSGNPFALLNAFDAEIKAKIGSLVYKGATLSEIALDAGVRGGVLTLRRLAVGDLAGAGGVFAGVVDGIKADFNITYDLKTNDAARLFRLAGKAPPSFPLGDLGVQGRVSGSPSAVTLDLNVAVMGADVGLDGSFADPLAAPRYDLTLAVDHPDFAALAERMAGGGRFGNRDLGAVKLRAGIVGDLDQLRIEDIDASLGRSRISGAVSADFDGPRPRFEADLTTGELVADMIFPGTPRGAGATAAAESTAPGERWSGEVIDLTGLHGFDLKAEIASKALEFRKYRLDDVTLRMKVADGVLDVEELSGRLYDGATTIRARLAATAPPMLDVSFTLKDADLRALMIDAAGLRAISGRLDLSGRLDSRGDSAFALVSALQGEAIPSLRDGMIEGLNLGRLNESLSGINSKADLIALIGGALNGGATIIQSLDGRFTLRDGILRSDDLRAVLDGGEGRATASLDLSRRQLDLIGEFRLSDFPKAPPLGFSLRGPIDNPRRGIRDKALREYVTTKIIAAGIGELIPALIDIKHAPAKRDTPLKPARKKQFLDMLESLIQGVGK